MTPGGKLRELLRGEPIIQAPGAYDGLSATLIAQAGFPAVYMTGAGTSAARGFPDYPPRQGTDDEKAWRAANRALPRTHD